MSVCPAPEGYAVRMNPVSISTTIVYFPWKNSRTPRGVRLTVDPMALPLSKVRQKHPGVTALVTVNGALPGARSAHMSLAMEFWISSLILAGDLPFLFARNLLFSGFGSGSVKAPWSINALPGKKFPS